MHNSRIALATLAAACLAAAGGCSTTNNAPPAAAALTHPAQQSPVATMVATDQIGAAVFADDTALAGDFRPYAGRLDGPAHAAFIIHANNTAFAGVRTD